MHFLTQVGEDDPVAPHDPQRIPRDARGVHRRGDPARLRRALHQLPRSPTVQSGAGIVRQRVVHRAQLREQREQALRRVQQHPDPGGGARAEGRPHLHHLHRPDVGHSQQADAPEGDKVLQLFMSAVQGPLRAGDLLLRAQVSQLSPPAAGIPLTR